MAARRFRQPARLVAVALGLVLATVAPAGSAARDVGRSDDDLDAAIARYRSAVREIERTADRRDPRLAEPLHGLGLALSDAGRHGEAATVLAQAVLVRRVHSGLHGLEQLEYYDDWTQSLYAAGRDEDVVGRQLARVEIVERAAGKGSPEHLDALADAAIWLRRVGRPHEERELHERRLEILRAAPGTSDRRVVGVLRDVARSYGAAYQPDVRAPLALAQALEILERAPGDHRVERAEVLADLGDFYFLFGSHASARHYHDRALALVADDDTAFEAIFGAARALRVPEQQEPSALGREPSYAEAGLSLTVDARGRVIDVVVVEIHPDTATARAAAVSSASRGRFRPRFARSGPVETRNVRHLHRFRHGESALAEVE